MSMTTAASPGPADAVDRCLVDEPRFLGAGDHPWPDACLLGDGAKELAAVFGLAGRARGDGDNFINLMGFGQTPEFRQDLKGGVHGLRRQSPAVEPAGPQTDHFLFPVNDFEGQVGSHLNHDHVQRIGADVDCRNAHCCPVLTIMIVYVRPDKNARLDRPRRTAEETPR